jgi:hypothetical protein
MLGCATLKTTCRLHVVKGVVMVARQYLLPCFVWYNLIAVKKYKWRFKKWEE